MESLKLRRDPIVSQVTDSKITFDGTIPVSSPFTALVDRLLDKKMVTLIL